MEDRRLEGPTHAELAAQIPEPPGDDENEAIQFARKTFRWTALLTLGFVAGAVFVMFLL